MLRSDKGLFLLKLDIWRFKSSFNAKLSSSQPFTMYPKAGFTPNVWSSKRGSGLSLKYQQNCTSFFPDHLLPYSNWYGPSLQSLHRHFATKLRGTTRITKYLKKSTRTGFFLIIATISLSLRITQKN